MRASFREEMRVIIINYTEECGKFAPGFTEVTHVRDYHVSYFLPKCIPESIHALKGDKLKRIPVISS